MDVKMLKISKLKTKDWKGKMFLLLLTCMERAHFFFIQQRKVREDWARNVIDFVSCLGLSILQSPVIESIHYKYSFLIILVDIFIYTYNGKLLRINWKLYQLSGIVVIGSLKIMTVLVTGSWCSYRGRYEYFLGDGT